MMLSSGALNLELKLTQVECNLEQPLVHFYGQYTTVCEFDYHILQNEMQLIPKVKGTVGTGEFCFVEDTDREWYRGRVLERKNEIYKVFLIDIGNVLTVTAAHIAVASGEMFQIPSKVVQGIFANILPVVQKWSPLAVKYFSSLKGSEVKGYVQETLPQHVILLEVPHINSQAFELHLAKYVDSSTFCLLVELLKELPPNTRHTCMPDLLQEPCRKPELSFIHHHKLLPNVQLVVDHMKPCLQGNVVMCVKIVTAVSPQKFYCQNIHYIKDLEVLSHRMSLYYDAMSTEDSFCDHFGIFCAAKRKDGQWHRGIMQQLLPTGLVVVWFTDFGICEAVIPDHVRKLKPEFNVLPVMSIPCTLTSLGIEDETAKTAQLAQFKQGLLGHPLYAYIDHFDTTEFLYYVTLCSQDRNPNGMEMVVDRIMQDIIPSKSKYTEHTSDVPLVENNSVQMNGGTSSLLFLGEPQPKVNTLTGKDPFSKYSYQTTELKESRVYTAYVEYVLNPSNFWIRTNEHDTDFEEMMQNLADSYNPLCLRDRSVDNPEPGLICCARYSKDLHFYRAVITEVLDIEVVVYFLDFGNTDTVPFSFVKTLNPEFFHLPALAVCCSLADLYPVDDVWTKNVNDFFKKAVFNKALLVYVISKKGDKYMVDIHDTDIPGEPSIISLMTQAGHAEYWEIEQKLVCGAQVDSKVPTSKKLQNKLNVRYNKCTSEIKNNKILQRKESACQSQFSSFNSYRNENLLTSLPSKWKDFACRNAFRSRVPAVCISPYKQHSFNLGSLLDVKCSSFISPTEFWCQPTGKLTELHALMSSIQRYYAVHSDPYQVGQTACIAKSSKDGNWYRAAVIKQLSCNELEVIFVDYGTQERKYLSDLRALRPDFLILEAQAFRCSLYSLIEPIDGDPFNWNKDACMAFGDFLNTECSMPLKCVVYALTFFNRKGLCNIVDLCTSFISARQFLIDKGHAKKWELQKVLSPVIQLQSFYYSSFGIKVGSEEEIYVTHINSPAHFYCQLGRNSGIVDALITDIETFTKLIHGKKKKMCSSGVCVARYFGDGHWYRGLASPTESMSHLKVFFVDFGDIHIIEADEVISIPDDALQLLFTPMQAIKCQLSDIVAELPVHICKYFENNTLDKLLKAVFVGKECDGSLLVEVYDGNLCINQKIDEMLYLEKKKQHSSMIPETKNSTTFKEVTVNSTNSKNRLIVQTKVKKQFSNTVLHDTDVAVVDKRTEVLVSKTKIKDTEPDLLQVVVESKLDASPSDTPRLEHVEEWESKESNEFSKQMNHFTSVEKANEQWDEVLKESQQSCSLKLSNISDLPQYGIVPCSKHIVYISHVINPSDLFVQFAADEDAIAQLAEELNEDSNCDCLSTIPGGIVAAGDLVAASYAYDGSMYRAFVKQVFPNGSLEVEFIDYGNSAIVNDSDIYQLNDKFLAKPRLSLHVSLCGAQGTDAGGSWSNEAVQYFAGKLNDKAVTCEFFQLSGQQWRVRITYDDKDIAEELIARNLAVCILSPKILATGKEIYQPCALSLNSNAKKQTLQHKTVDKKDSTLVLFAECEDAVEKIYIQKMHPQQVKAGQVEIVTVLLTSGAEQYFYIKLKNHMQIPTVSGLTFVLEEAEGSSSITKDDLREWLECLAKSDIDSQWYRAEIKKCNRDDGNVLVFLVDFGKVEVVCLSNISMLTQKIENIPKQLLLCKYVDSENNGEKNEFFPDTDPLFADREIKIVFVSYNEASQAWEVEVNADEALSLDSQCLLPLVGTDDIQLHPDQRLNVCESDVKNEVNNSLVLEKQDTEAFSSKSLPTETILPDICAPLPENHLPVFDRASFNLNEAYKGFATAVLDPSDFHIQLEDSFEVMKTLSSLLLELSESLPSLIKADVIPGSFCLIRCVFDKQWYRGEIAEVTDTFILVKCIDYGFCIYVSHTDIDKLKVLPEVLSRLPRLACSCVLRGVMPPNSKQWTDEAANFFQECLAQQSLIIKFQQFVRGVGWVVEIFVNNEKAADKLVAARHAIYSALNPWPYSTYSDVWKVHKSRFEIGSKECLDNSFLKRWGKEENGSNIRLSSGNKLLHQQQDLEESEMHAILHECVDEFLVCKKDELMHKLYDHPWNCHLSGENSYLNNDSELGPVNYSSMRTAKQQLTKRLPTERKRAIRANRGTDREVIPFLMSKKNRIFKILLTGNTECHQM
ncbi:tudor domain-containing protein 15 [Protopterus annectens]|uniref:tudor domain-containing protein 15 n=1 Tax=Protopterus annectens TaxID=7888 RepID=UPI001CF92F26|nr:tudor domain-containing protein 15 [Protopterus annectens]